MKKMNRKELQGCNGGADIVHTIGSQDGLHGAIIYSDGTVKSW